MGDRKARVRIARLATGTERSVLPATRRPRARQSGFTLIELLVVLLLAAALMGVVGANFAGRSAGVEFDAAARDLFSALRYARSEAIARGEEVRLMIDLESRSYWIEGRPERRRLPETIEVHLVTGETLVENEHRAGFGFFPDGAATGGRIVLSGDTRSIELDINWLTGRVDMH